MIAAFATLPVLLTGLLAWPWQLGGHKLKGIILPQHRVLGVTSSVLIWLVWWMHRRPRWNAYRLPLELFAAFVVAITAHLGGFLSGINTPW